MFHVIQLMFKYLNDECLCNAELTCKAWKEDIYYSHLLNFGIYYLSRR